MNAYIDTIKVTDENGEKAILYPRTKQNAVEGLEERLVKLEVADITETEDTTLENSNAGRLLFTEIDGAMEQGENPSSTNPQEIRKSEVSGIRTHGKNFLNCSGLTEQTINGVTFTPVYENGMLQYINANGTPTATAVYYVNADTKLDVNKSYIITDGQNGHISTYYTQLYNDTISNLPNTFSGEFVPEDLIYAIRIIVKTAVSNLKFYPMIRYADVEDATYEPYTESSITFSQPIELYGKDDVRDILTSKQIGRKYAKVVFDGSDDEAWNGSSTVGRYYMNNWGCKGYGFLMCSQAKGVQNGDEELNTCYIHAASNGRFIINTEIPTMTEWKAHLASNPMTVVYELAEETTEELPIADQIALNSLQTFDGITYVEFISDIQPTFKGEYGTSKVGGMTLESLLTARSNDLRLSAVESAVVNNI